MSEEKPIEWTEPDPGAEDGKGNYHRFELVYDTSTHFARYKTPRYVTEGVLAAAGYVPAAQLAEARAALETQAEQAQEWKGIALERLNWRNDDQAALSQAQQRVGELLRDMEVMTGERNALQQDLEAEQAGRLATRKRYGARDDETFGQFLERVLGSPIPAVAQREERIADTMADRETCGPCAKELARQVIETGAGDSETRALARKVLATSPSPCNNCECGGYIDPPNEPAPTPSEGEPSLLELLAEYERIHGAANALIPDGGVKDLATRGGQVTARLLRRLVDAVEGAARGS